MFYLDCFEDYSTCSLPEHRSKFAIDLIHVFRLTVLFVYLHANMYMFHLYCSFSTVARRRYTLDVYGKMCS